MRWEHSSGRPSLQPSQPYDKEGIFTGCSWPTGPHGEKNMITAIYSSITALPIHWTLEHTRYSEGVSLATSTDGGKTWTRSELNPILRGEPEDLKVTGFRDPFLAAWPSLDKVRGRKSLYAALSGGIVGKGPTVFIYAVAPDDLTRWEYLGPLVDMAPNTRTPGPWTGELGVNWECVNYMTLSNGETEREFLLMGAEGAKAPDYRRGEDDPHGAWSLWVAGTLETTPGGPRLRHDYDGFIDHGCLYAPNSFEHPVSKKRVAFGWIKEEELTLARREAKGWTGFLSMPRELFLYTAQNVVRGLRSPIEAIRSVKVIEEGPRGKTVETLGTRPFADIRSQAHVSLEEWYGLGSGTSNGLLKEKSACSWELDAVLSVHPSQACVGFYICHSTDGSQRTAVTFDVQREKIVLDRSLSNREADIKKYDMSGAFTLFYQDNAGTEELEKLHLRIFRDGDTLEIFANDRFALSATVYVDHESCAAISWFIEGGESQRSPVFETIQLWEDMTPSSSGHMIEVPHPHL